MRGSEFKRKVENLARARNAAARWEAAHGKGSHGRLWYGARFTTLKDLKKEISPGLLKAMCDQLGIALGELLDPGRTRRFTREENGAKDV